MHDDYARQYEELWNTHWWWRARKQFVLARLRALARRRLTSAGEKPSLGNILDIGCGNGLFFPDLQRLGEVAGIEPDPLLVAADGPYRHKIDVRGFDASYLPLPGKNPDLVLMLDVLEHLRDDRAAARRVRDILAPGGYFLVTVPALMSLWSAHDDANVHFRRYTKSSLRRLLVEAGFHVESLHYFFGWTLGPLFIRRVLSPGHAPADGASPQTPSPPSATSYRVGVPTPLVNSFFYGLSRLEQTTVGRRGLPVGSSLIALAGAAPPKGVRIFRGITK